MINKDFLMGYGAGKAAGGGSGSSVKVISKVINANGIYTAPTGKAFSPVSVNVPFPYPTYGKVKVVNDTSVNITVAGYNIDILQSGEYVFEPSDSFLRIEPGKSADFVIPVNRFGAQDGYFSIHLPSVASAHFAEYGNGMYLNAFLDTANNIAVVRIDRIAYDENYYVSVAYNT